jgi:nitrogen fixation NifU-like protein
MVTELAQGKTLNEAKKSATNQLLKRWRDLPENKLHCSNVGADALRQAIRDYENRNVKRPETRIHHYGSIIYGGKAAGSRMVVQTYAQQKKPAND